MMVIVLDFLQILVCGVHGSSSNVYTLFCFRFYRGDLDVQEDTELQAFVNELSAQGTGPDGGRGQVINNNKNNCSNTQSLYYQKRKTLSFKKRIIETEN